MFLPFNTMNLLKHIYKKTTRLQPQTWWAHGAISLMATGCGGLFSMKIGFFTATGCLALYTLKELYDILDHYSELKAKMDVTGVNPLVDLHGDLIGPVMVWLTWAVAWMLAP